MMKEKILKITQGGLLSALAVGLSAVESLLPSAGFLPPGCRIGFANLAVMLAAKNVSFGAAFAVTIVKSLFVLLTRGATAFLLSLAGGLASTAVVVLLFGAKKSRFGCLGAGILGALAHNTAQLCVYAALTGVAAFWYAPVLLAFGTAGGVLTGLLLYLTQNMLHTIRRDGQK